MSITEIVSKRSTLRILSGICTFLLVCNIFLAFSWKNEADSPEFTWLYSERLQLELPGSQNQTGEVLGTFIEKNVVDTGAPDLNNVETENYAWVPHFDFSNGLASARKNSAALREVHITGGSISSSGELIFVPQFSSFLNQAKTVARPIGITIYSGGGGGLSSLLDSNTLQEAFINKVFDYTQIYSHISAININFEKLSNADATKFLKFLTFLKTSTQNNNIKLYVTVFPIGGHLNQSLTADVIGSYSKLAEVSDKLVLMGYDYVLHFADTPGRENPNVPDYWLKEFLAQAVSQVSSSKLILGLPLYGYGYSTSSKKMTTSYTYNQIQSIISREQRQPVRIPEWNEMKLQRGSEVIYFQNEETLRSKKSIAVGYGVDQVFYWRLGSDGTLIK